MFMKKHDFFSVFLQPPIALTEPTRPTSTFCVTLGAVAIQRDFRRSWRSNIEIAMMILQQQCHYNNNENTYAPTPLYLDSVIITPMLIIHTYCTNQVVPSYTEVKSNDCQDKNGILKFTPCTKKWNMDPQTLFIFEWKLVERLYTGNGWMDMWFCLKSQYRIY